MSVAQRSGASDAYDAEEPGDCQALASLYADHYTTLVRMAALLTGDARCADDVAIDSFAALCSAGLVGTGNRAVSYLRRQVVIRSRLAARQPSAQRCGQAAETRPGSEPAPGEFDSLPVVLGLMTLRPAEREALVLTSYLDLPERQAAAAAGVTPGALRLNLASAAERLRAWLPS
jgi:DNA-directed RNA polymerase specialized sigma24 family protein